MRMYLDNEPCTGEASTVGDAIAVCSAAAQEQGRCVVEVIVDGSALTNEQLGHEDLVSATAGEVRMISAEPTELVCQTLADSAAALEEARTLQDDAAALLQSGDSEDAMDRLGEAFSIWISVQQAVMQGSQLVGLDLDACSVAGKPLLEYITALTTQLEAIQEQLENDDLVGVADTLLYDLPQVVEQWRQMLESLQRTITEA